MISAECFPVLSNSSIDLKITFKADVHAAERMASLSGAVCELRNSSRGGDNALSIFDEAWNAKNQTRTYIDATSTSEVEE